MGSPKHFQFLGRAELPRVLFAKSDFGTSIEGLARESLPSLKRSVKMIDMGPFSADFPSLTKLAFRLLLFCQIKNL